MKNYTFIKPFKTTIGSKDADALSIGAVPFKEINFQIGDKIIGSPFGGLDTSRVVETRIGNAYLNIPLEYLKEEVVKQPIVNAPVNVPSTKKQTFLEKNQNKIIAIGVPLGFYAFSKYKKYDDKKTAKVTIIGSVVVLGLVVLNGFSGAWTGTTFMDRTFGKQKYW